MHKCGDTANNLKDATNATGTLKQSSAALVTEVKETALNTMNADGKTLQEMFGQAGDPDASNVLQNVKVYAGKIEKSLKPVEDQESELGDLVDETTALKDSKFESNDDVKSAEAIIEKMEAANQLAEENINEATEVFASTQRGMDQEDDHRGQSYYSAMYFVDKEHQLDQSTCSGKLDENPLYNTNPDACAAACDAEPGQCVGFSYYQVGDTKGACFLVNEFKTLQHYTECDQLANVHAGAHNGTALVQIAPHAFLTKKTKKEAAYTVGCYAKLSLFEGTKLKAKVTKAQRCFQKEE
jgi:hypothetical protein